MSNCLGIRVTCVFTSLNRSSLYWSPPLSPISEKEKKRQLCQVVTTPRSKKIKWYRQVCLITLFFILILQQTLAEVVRAVSVRHSCKKALTVFVFVDVRYITVSQLLTPHTTTDDSCVLTEGKCYTSLQCACMVLGFITELLLMGYVT